MEDIIAIGVVLILIGLLLFVLSFIIGVSFLILLKIVSAITIGLFLLTLCGILISALLNSIGS